MKPNEKEFERQFLAAFRDPLAAWGFQYAGGFYFTLERQRVRHGIQFGRAYRYTRMRFEFMMGTGVTHPAVNDLCGPEVFPEGSFTVGISVYCRTRPETFGYWYLEDPACVPEVLDCIQREVLPFLERFSDLSEIRRALEAGWPPPFIIARDHVVWLLAAIMALQGDRDKALAMLDQALEERRGQLPKHWLDVASVRHRLLSWSGKC